jgi:protein dithiol oxidoreductase (disulfide-forming)
MKNFWLLSAVLGVVLAGCGHKQETTATPAAPAPAPAADTVAPASPATAGDPALAKAAKATQESTGGAEDPSDASLERLAAMPESAQLPGGKWKVGVNYTPIVPAQSTSAEPGQVEVLEIFWLGCPHCYELESYLDAWKQKKPAYVKFVQEHVMWGPSHRAHAKFFYTLQALGKADALLPKVFDEIHRRGNMLVANNDAESLNMELAFAKANGISESDFKREFNGFAVNTKLQRAEELMRRYRVESVPVIVVNGKYRTDVSMAGGHDQLIQLINDLAASEKRR